MLRPLQYTDSASSVRVPTPTSQQPVGLRSGTSVKNQHQTPSSYCRRSKSMSGGLLFPGGNMEYTPTAGRNSGVSGKKQHQQYTRNNNKSSSPGGGDSVNGQDDLTASTYSAAAIGPITNTATGGYQMYDPILINKRYPMESERQIGRWTSESRNSYGGLNKTKKSTSPNKMF